jgi:molybdopterin synthase sulfur carrier subunit
VSAQVTVRYWAGARRAAGRDSEQLSAGNLRDLLSQLGSRPALTDVIAASSVLVDGIANPSDNPLAEGAVVDILPPFAGG